MMSVIGMRKFLLVTVGIFACLGGRVRMTHEREFYGLPVACQIKVAAAAFMIIVNAKRIA